MSTPVKTAKNHRFINVVNLNNPKGVNLFEEYPGKPTKAFLPAVPSASSGGVP